MLGRSWKLSEGAETDPETAARLHQAVECGEELWVPVRHHRRDGTAYWSETLMAPVYAKDGTVTHYLSVQKDVTEKTEASQRAAHMAYHDTLTGPPNRAQLQEQVSLALARAERKGTAVAVLFLDLNGFKQVNDRHGHESGDRLLQDIVRRWRATARHGDVLARYGGDEFVPLMTDIPRDSARDTAATAAAPYADALRLPFDAQSAPATEAMNRGGGLGHRSQPCRLPARCRSDRGTPPCQRPTNVRLLGQRRHLLVGRFSPIPPTTRRAFDFRRCATSSLQLGGRGQGRGGVAKDP